MKVYIVLLKFKIGSQLFERYYDCYLDETAAYKAALSISGNGQKGEVLEKEFKKEEPKPTFDGHYHIGDVNE